MNLNEVAKEVTLAEGLEAEVKIGDVKEIMNIIMTKYKLHEVVQIWMKYNKIKA